jgi:hypothetical protein
MDTNEPRYLSNNPPDPIADLLEQLRETHQPLQDRRDEILDAGLRVPDVGDADDDDTANRLADFVKVTSAFLKNADAARVSAKEPHLAAGRAVDGFFKKMADPVEKLKASLTQMLTSYQRRKADEERRRREELARQERERAAEEARLAKEAARLAREAADEESRRLAEEARDRAAAAREAAHAAKAEATVKAAELSRTRTDLGSVASLRTTYAFEVEDAELVPRVYLAVSEPAIRAAIKAATTPDGRCNLKIPGVKIFERTISIVR